MKKTNDHVFIRYMYDLIISTNFDKDCGVFLDQNPLCSFAIIGHVYVGSPTTNLNLFYALSKPNIVKFFI